MGANFLITRINPVCDFCSDPEVVIAYPIEDFILEEYCWASKGAFAACRTCMTLIERNQRKNLEHRSVTLFIQKHGTILPQSVIRQFVHRLHEEFWARLVKI